jgi:DNA polymerase-3 subunit alpha
MLEPILNETFGLILYQEQVQALALQVSHFTLSEGDLMRRAMGKKMIEIMAEYREKFIKQADDTTGGEIAGAIFDQIEYFAGYGFNKSHSACYALIAYQTAYLKAHFPKEYMAALLTSKLDDTKKVVDYINECEDMGIEVKAPDVNESRAEFTVVGEHIRFGLGAVKGVGVKAIESMVKEREENGNFKDLYDFCERVDLHSLNKGNIEGLIKSGSMDCLPGHRAQLIAALEGAVSAGQRAAKARARNQTSLFGGGTDDDEDAFRAVPELPDIPNWTEKEQLALEKSVIGFYVSGHPLGEYRKTIETFANARVEDLKKKGEKAEVLMGLIISSIRLMNTKKGDRYARIVFEDDAGGAINAIVWPRTYEECRDLLLEDNIVFVKAKVSRQRDEPEILVDEVIHIDQAEEKLSRAAKISINASLMTDEKIEAMANLLKAHAGDCPVYFNIVTEENRKVMMRASKMTSVRPNKELIKDIDNLIEKGSITFSATTV